MAKEDARSVKTVDKTLNILIAVGVIVALVLAAMIIFPDLTSFLSSRTTSDTQSDAPQLQSFTIDEIPVESDISEELAGQAISFVKESLQEPYVPSTLIIQKAQDATEQTGPAHIANWNIDGKYVSLLIGLTPDSSRIAYLRAWYMPAGDSTDKEEAESLLSDVFKTTYVNDAIALTCRSLKDPQGAGEDIVECNQMKTIDDGSLKGFTVRAPITLEPPPDTQLPPGVTPQKTIAVSACYVPVHASPLYPADTCL